MKRRSNLRFRYWKRLFHRVHPAWMPLGELLAAKWFDRAHRRYEKPRRIKP